MGTLTGPSFQSAEKRCFHVLHVWEEKLWNQSPSLKKFIRLELCQKCVKSFKSSSSKAKKVQSGCLLGTGDWRILCVLRNVRLPMTTFYTDKEPLSKYSPVTLPLSPANRMNS